MKDGPQKNTPNTQEVVGNSVSGYGTSESIGGRRTMEDASIAIPNFLPSGFYGEAVSLFLVCDGHGIKNGERASQFVRDNLPNVLRQKVQSGVNPTQALTDAFEEVDELMQTHPEMDDTGTTATLVLVEGGRLIVANAGDTESLLNRGGQSITLTQLHKAYLESDRIISAGGTMRQGRVIGTSGAGNAVGRSLGEKTLGKPYVIATPTVNIVDLQSDDSRLVIGCDGLLDEVRHEEIFPLIKDITNPQEASEKLVKESAEVRCSQDNVSAIVVNLKQL